MGIHVSYRADPAHYTRRAQVTALPVSPVLEGTCQMTWNTPYFFSPIEPPVGGDFLPSAAEQENRTNGWGPAA